MDHDEVILTHPARPSISISSIDSIHQFLTIQIYNLQSQNPSTPFYINHNGSRRRIRQRCPPERQPNRERSQQGPRCRQRGTSLISIPNHLSNKCANNSQPGDLSRSHKAAPLPEETGSGRDVFPGQPSGGGYENNSGSGKGGHEPKTTGERKGLGSQPGQ